MNGRPVWLASASLRDRLGQTVPSARWSPADRDLLEQTLEDALNGVGDPSRQRFFRMPITACYHRALNDREVAGLPGWWHAAPAVDLAGGPAEVMWETGIDPVPSTQPCLQPGRQPLGRDPELYLLQDCGQCLPCQTRAAARETPIATPAEGMR